MTQLGVNFRRQTLHKGLNLLGNYLKARGMSRQIAAALFITDNLESPAKTRGELCEDILHQKSL